MTKEEFTQAVLDMNQLLYRMARTQLQSSADREDAVQETLRRAWEKRERLRETQAMKGWMVRILLNVCHDMQRRQSRMQPVEQLPETAASEAEHPLLDALMTIDPKYRAVIELHHVEGWDVGEIARMLHLPVGTVKSRLSRGRKELQKAYEKEALEE